MMMSARNRSPFTASQWQELEHQALIFKYIVSGVPIPPDLICTVKRSLDSSFSSRLFPHQPFGWGCFQMGFGRKADPEPGRCRRTDGKKWRCSKEAYPDSKYCERHMHRGKNRSRKPVEVISAANPSPAISSINSNPPSSTNSYSLSPLSPLSSSMTSETPHPHHHSYHNSSLCPFLYPHPSRPQANSSYGTHHLFFDSGSYSQADRDYRHHHGMREGVDERAFFPEASGTVRGLHDFPSQFQYQSLADSTKRQQEQQEQQHCFVLGTDFKSSRPMKVERDDQGQKPLHHFFGEWPLKNRDSWLDLEEDPPPTHASFSTTQLSISIPMSSQKLLASDSRIQTGT